MANIHLQQTFIRLQREIEEHDRQIEGHQKEKAQKAEALAGLKDHAPQAPAAEPVTKPAK